MKDKIILNNVPQIRLQRLKEWGYLKANGWQYFSITWHHNLGWNESKSITVRMSLDEEPHLILDYLLNGEAVNYRVNLVSVPSNIGKGLVWYFVCPKTNKRCRKLHLVEGYFYHHSAFENTCYLSETFADEWKEKYKDIQKLKRNDKAYNFLYAKHRRTHYKGKPTKKYLQALKWIEEAKGISEADIYY